MLLIAGALHCRSTMDDSSLTFGSRQSPWLAKLLECACVNASDHAYCAAVPLQVEPVQVWPREQRIHINPVRMSVTVPSLLSRKREAGVLAGIELLQAAPAAKPVKIKNVTIPNLNIGFMVFYQTNKGRKACFGTCAVVSC